MPKARTPYSLLSALYTFIGLLFYWKPVMLSAQEYFFGPGGDGIKNYFTPLHYILYGDGLRFTGMNYPYGEHLAYCDAQPALTVWMHQLLNGNTEYAFNIIASINLLMLLSIPVAAIFLTKLFSLWKMPGHYSSVAAAAIALLSPQVFRMTGHYALAYACFVPMVWYYASAWLQNKRWGDVIKLFLTLLIFGGLHAYYFALGAAFLLPVAVLYPLFRRREKKAWLHALLLALATILPLVIYSIWLQVTGANEFSDRHSRPWGFFHYTATISSIFLPHQGMVKEWLDGFFPLKSNEFEGIAYVGTAAIIAWLAGLVLLRKWLYQDGETPPNAVIFTIAGVTCLLVSMSFPFNVVPSAWIPGPVWQFRALGRFAWAFYYVFAAMGAWWLYLVAESFRKRGQSVVAMGLVIFMLILWLAEGLSAQKQVSSFVKEYGHSADKFLSGDNNYAQWLKEAGKNPEDFQAILSFPYFSMGSEEIYIERGGSGLLEACKASVSLNLPIAQTFLGRSSMEQTLNVVQLMSHPLIPKKILGQLPNEKPFLLITSYESPFEDEKRIIAGSKLLFSRDEIKLYEVPLSVFKDVRNAYSLQQSSDKSWKAMAGLTAEGAEIWIKGSGIHFWKDGFKPVDEKVENALLMQWTADQMPVKEYELSVWIPIILKDAAFPVLYVDQKDANGQLLQQDYCNPKVVTDVYEGAVRASVIFQRHPEMKTLDVRLEGRDIAATTLLLRALDTEVYTKTLAGRNFWNNYPMD